jgi:branched-subunit amino acid transport protein AzlD
MSQTEALVTILVVAAGTYLTRALPFWLFPDRKQPPEWVRKLGTVLPYAMMGLLVVYSLKGVWPPAKPYGLPEALSLLFIFGLHKWKRNTLLSIAGGTVAYMLLSQQVFV